MQTDGQVDMQDDRLTMPMASATGGSGPVPMSSDESTDGVPEPDSDATEVGDEPARARHTSASGRTARAGRYRVRPDERRARQAALAAREHSARVLGLSGVGEACAEAQAAADGAAEWRGDAHTTWVSVAMTALCASMVMPATNRFAGL